MMRAAERARYLRQNGHEAYAGCSGTTVFYVWQYRPWI